MDKIEATGTGLLGDALEEAGQHIPMPCRQRHTCGKCGIYVSGVVDPPGTRERELLARQRSVPAPLPGFVFRLACLATFHGQANVIASSISDVAVAEVGPELVAYDGDAPDTYGCAVDIGTTTVTVMLMRLGDGERLGDVSSLNHQAAHGADVLSRIDAASQRGVETLQRLIVDQVDAMIADVLESAGVAPDEVTRMTVTGNTTMLHLLCGLPVSTLGVSPFTPVTLFGQTCAAVDLFPSLVNAELYLPPGVSTYVGPDIVCGMLVAGMGTGAGNSLLVDIGTNGEMALSIGGRIRCCSTAAGPAFEGGEISEGMPALPGAIDETWAGDGRIGYTTVRNKRPRGICGTGLISVVDTLLGSGQVDGSGFMEDGEVEIGDSRIHVTQADIRKLQLAKASVAAGMDTLVSEAGVGIEEVGSLYLAGGFGSYMQGAPAAGIGLIPETLVERTEPAGNSALTGAVLLTLSLKAREVAERLADEAEEVQLATSPVFMTRYVENMSFGEDLDPDD